MERVEQSSPSCAASAKRTAADTGQVALNWLIAKGAVPIPGAKNPEQAEENAGALGWSLADEEWRRSTGCARRHAQSPTGSGSTAEARSQPGSSSNEEMGGMQHQPRRSSSATNRSSVNADMTSTLRWAFARPLGAGGGAGRLGGAW